MIGEQHRHQPQENLLAMAMSIPTFPAATFPGFTMPAFSMPSFPGVPAFDVTTLPSIPTIPGFPDVPSWVFGAAIAEEAGVQLPTADFGEFSFPTLEAGTTFADLITVPEGLEGTAACSALWVPGNLETCTAAYTEGLTAYSEYLSSVSTLPIADVLAVEGVDYTSFVEGYTQMMESWTPAMAGATFSG